MMFLLKLPFKLIAIPLVMAATLIQWIGIFLVGFSSVIFNLFAGLAFMVAIFSYLMRISTGSEALKMLIMAFVVFMVPAIGEWLIERIMGINEGLKDFIRS